MSDQKSLWDTDEPTSSQALEDGNSPLPLPDGRQTVPSGPVRVPASHFHKPEGDEALRMNDICGLFGMDSSVSVALQRSLESRLLVRLADSGEQPRRAEYEQASRGREDSSEDQHPVSEDKRQGREVGNNPADCSSPDRVEYTDCAGPLKGSGTTEASRHGCASEPAGSGMAHAESSECQQPRRARSGREGFTDHSSGLGNAKEPRLEGHSGYGDRGKEPGRLKEGQVGQDMRPSPWSYSEWVYGRDGKTRRIEPGTPPLAHGVPARVGQIRAYGNAIVPQVAAEFISAAMETKEVPA